MAEYSGYSLVSPQWLELVSEFPELDNLDKIGIIERRQLFDKIEFSIPPRQLPDDIKEDLIAVHNFTITARDGYEIPVRSYIPKLTQESSPILVYLHAGGFLFGNLESGDMNCRILATRLNLSVLNVDYRLAPKWPFPHGLNDSYDVTEWVAANAEKYLKASPAKGFIVGGISSGANFAGVIAYLARDAGLLPPITGLWLSIPVCIMPEAYGNLPAELRNQLLSLEQNNNNPLLTRKSLHDIQELYKCTPDDPRISFLLNTDHSNLPRRAYFQICGRDPLRDEAFLWQKLLRSNAGAKCKTHLYSGMPHGFWRFLQMRASQGWADDMVEGIGFLLKPEDEVEENEIEVKGF